MMKRVAVILCILSAFVVTSCATVSDAGYYWGDYSKTLYAYDKAPSNTTLEAHINELQSIINYSNNNDLKVPPGVYAEAGFFLSKQANVPANVVLQYYQNEVELYPESRFFLERLISDLE
jgi:hypothetical protein